MAQKTFEITEEQLAAIESDYMTRDTIAIIATEVRKHDTSTFVTLLPDDRAKWLLAEAKKVIDLIADPAGACNLYGLGGEGSFCHTGCPAYDRRDGVDKRCMPRVISGKIRNYLGVR